MYDELERAAGARTRSGPSILGWIAVVAATVVLLGAAGTYLAYRAVRHQVEQVVERFEHLELGSTDGSRALVAHTVARTLDELGAVPAVDGDVLAASVGRALADRSSVARDVQRGARQGEGVDGTLRIRTEEGEFTADLRADEAGGALVVRRPDGRVIVDLAADGAGARLQVGIDGEVARIEAGPGAVQPPRWLPWPDDRPRDVQRVISGRAGDAEFGALAWSSDADPQSLVDAWRARLEGDGWTVRAEHRLETDFDGRSASAVARQADADRVVLLVAGADEGATRVVFGWGEGIDPGR